MAAEESEISMLREHTRQSAAMIATSISMSTFLVLSLSGCDNNFSNGPISIIRDGSEIKIAACIDLTYDRITADQRNYAEQRPWSVLWEEERSGSLASGDTITSNAADPSIESGGNPQFSRGDDILIIFYGSDDVVAQFSIGPSGLSESRWLHPDGTETDQPCHT